MYINKSGALLERMANSGVDIVSLDWTVTIEEARLRIGNKAIFEQCIENLYDRNYILFR